MDVEAEVDGNMSTSDVSEMGGNSNVDAPW